MILIVAKYLIPKGYSGIAIFPFVLVKYRINSKNKVLVNHEKIHLRQQLELFIIPFFVWYLLEFLVRLIQFKKVDLAYRNISFEREAYANEKDINYLKQRSLWRFCSYI